MSGIPILVEGEGLRVLIVGGGAVAARKAAAMSRAGATVRVVSPAAGDEMVDLQSRGAVILVSRPYRAGDVDDADLVIAATNDRAINEAVRSDARAAGALANVVDAPGTGTFVTMATHRAGELVVGVSAGGVPNAASRIRDAIAARFDERYSRALAQLGSMRRLLIDRGDNARWRECANDILGGDFCEMVEAGALDARVAPWR